MNAMPRNSKTLESKQLGLFEQIQPEIVVTPVQQQQLTMLVEALFERDCLGARNRGGRQ